LQEPDNWEEIAEKILSLSDDELEIRQTAPSTQLDEDADMML
jgi:hypothetical protein